MRGGEKVLDALCERFPQAEVFTLVHVRGSVSPAIERARPHTSFVQRLPFVRQLYRMYLPLFPAAVEQFDFDGFDLIVSTSHCCVKSVVRPGRARHLCYCLTPMRYAWDQFDAYFGPERIGAAGSFVMRRAMAALARWDRDTAGRADRYVAISHYVAGRIRRYYNREATVVYPPVDTEFFTPATVTPRDQAPAAGHRYALVVSALVPYKRVDVAMDACRLARRAAEDRRRRTRAGHGSNARRPETSMFLGRRPDDEVRDLYRGAGVTLLPGEEDFGIVPVEAQACGSPSSRSAAAVRSKPWSPDETGVLVDDASAPAFADGIGRAMARRFDPALIRRHAERFSRERFSDEMAALITADA